MKQPSEKSTLLLLMDASSSMDVQDAPATTRAARAEQLLERLRESLGAFTEFETLYFDSRVRQAETDKRLTDDIRPTDLARCLRTVAERSDLAGVIGTVMLTDGGDEPVENIKLPQVPLYIAGVGTEPGGWNDLAVAELAAPPVVEEDAHWQVTADIIAHCATRDFEELIKRVKVTLSEKGIEGWQEQASTSVDLTGRQAQVKFELKAAMELGRREYRLNLEGVAGELSELNNSRSFSVEVRKKTLHVLFFAQELGWDFAMIRKELARDATVALTALFRVSSERIVVQGDRREGDEHLNAGFPAAKELLELYKCVIIGSFPASQWDGRQMQALQDYVQEGGAVIFLGGEHSFGLGGYAGTPLETLFPWRISGADSPLQLGRFPVHVPAFAAEHEIISATAQSLGQSDSAALESVNVGGSLKAGAISLLNAALGKQNVAVVGLQPYGQGQVMGVATNTLWKWARSSADLKEAYGHFWRQAVRYLARMEEGGRFLAITWDQQRYRPGEHGSATVRVAGRYQPGQLHLKTTLRGPGEEQPASVEAIAQRENEFTCEMVFQRRGEYQFAVEAFVGENVLERYEKTLAIGPRFNEGANLQVDHAFLSNLAAQGDGAYFRPGESDKLIETLKAKVVRDAIATQIPLVQDKYLYLVIFLGVLVMEWSIRRKMNLF